MNRSILFFLFLIFSMSTVNAQTEMITWADKDILDNLPTKYANSSFYVVSPRGNAMITGSFKDGKKNGSFLYFYEDRGFANEETYKDGVLHGYYKGQNENTIITIEEGYYHKGKKTGIWKISNRNQTEKITYKNGKKEGKYECDDWRFSNRKTEGQYKNEDGIYKKSNKDLTITQTFNSYTNSYYKTRIALYQNIHPIIKMEN